MLARRKKTGRTTATSGETPERRIPLPQLDGGGAGRPRPSDPGRRRFMQLSGVALAAAAAPKSVARAERGHGDGLDEDRMGVQRGEWPAEQAARGVR
mgnify:CR=1 FL=1